MMTHERLARWLISIAFLSGYIYLAILGAPLAAGAVLVFPPLALALPWLLLVFGLLELVR